MTKRYCGFNLPPLFGDIMGKMEATVMVKVLNKKRLQLLQTSDLQGLDDQLRKSLSLISTSNIIKGNTYKSAVEFRTELE